MMHIYNDIIERNDGESENNIIRGGMIMLRVDFTFDKKISIISDCKNSKEYSLLTGEEQDKLFIDLMSIDKRFK